MVISRGIGMHPSRDDIRAVHRVTDEHFQIRAREPFTVGSFEEAAEAASARKILRIAVVGFEIYGGDIQVPRLRARLGVRMTWHGQKVTSGRGITAEQIIASGEQRLGIELARLFLIKPIEVTGVRKRRWRFVEKQVRRGEDDI